MKYPQQPLLMFFQCVEKNDEIVEENENLLQVKVPLDAGK